MAPRNKVKPSKWRQGSQHTETEVGCLCMSPWNWKPPRQGDSRAELLTTVAWNKMTLTLRVHNSMSLSIFNELIWLLGLLCQFLCYNIIFPRVLNVASGVTQNNYRYKDDVKLLAISKKKKMCCDWPGNSLCSTDSFEWHFKADYLALFRQISHCNQHPSCVCLNRDFALIRNIELGS